MATFFLLFLCLSRLILSAGAQTISTNTPVPPLQWINLSPLLKGATSPPPLRNAALGYDETSRKLIVFGGESEGGFMQSQTYLLNLDTLTWSTPSPPVNLAATPPGRSSPVSAVDIAASNRHAFIIVGGKGSNNTPLSDIWAFDFINEFWFQVIPTNANQAPAARWGASGGLDFLRVPPIQDAILPGPNNTIYLSGGFDGNKIFPLSDVWKLHISGTLSSNMPDSVRASWERVPLDGTLPARTRQGGTVVGQHIVSYGGCGQGGGDQDADLSCAGQDAFVVDTSRGTSITPATCASGRQGPLLIGNFNKYSTNFASQVFLTLGVHNSSLWEDERGLEHGEIDILDTNTGTWSRVLPAGDPGSNGKPIYPMPRDGASAISYDRALVGTSRDGLSDTIVFGGRDASGRYLSDLWVLRSYRDSISSSYAQWSGYGDGNLQTGINANGAGVTVQYLTTCAVARASTSGDDPAPPSGSQQNASQSSIVHRLLSPISLTLLCLSLLCLRLLPLQLHASSLRDRIIVLFFAGFVFIAYVLGITGFISSFISAKPRDARHLSSPHGIASLAFFLCLYVIVPCLLFISHVLTRPHSKSSDKASGTTDLRRTLSAGTNEKLENLSMTPQTASTTDVFSPPASPRPRTQSASYPRPLSVDALSLGGASTGSGLPAPRRGFEVLNRPSRVPLKSQDHPSPALGTTLSTSRSLGDIDWLLRRRSLNAVGELDYALSMAYNAQRQSTALGENAQTTTPQPRRPPHSLSIAGYVVGQVGCMGLNLLSLVALWGHAPRWAFNVFLIWVIIFYFCVAWMPRRLEVESYLISLFPRHQKNHHIPPLPPSPPPATAETPANGPYLHTPPITRTFPRSSSTPLSVEEEDEEEEIDETTRQRMIEAEMDRREVSIITMPRRKLCVANPS